MSINEVVLNSYNPNVVLKTLANFFNSKVSGNYAELKLNIPKSYGEGYIAGLDFNDGLGILLFNCQFKKDFVIRYVSPELQPLRLIFCMENDFSHVIKADRMHYQLNYLLGSMVTGRCNNEQAFMLPAEKKVFYYSIDIDRKRYLPKLSKAIQSLPNELKDVFEDVECERPFLYQGHYSLTIAECIQKIHMTELEGLVRRVYLESKTLEILAMQIKQYLDDLEPSKKQTVIRKKDVDMIVGARSLLLENLVSPPTITELARKMGTNENKLKRGFRKLYGSSVYKVVQDERMSLAKLLIAEEKYSLKEIAGKIGYKHAGYFTAQLKNRFGILPKDYLKSLKDIPGENPDLNENYE